MGEFVDTLTGGAIWGVGFAAALGIAQSFGGLRPALKGAMRGVVATSDWVRGATQESRETLQDLYQEAKAEHEARA